MSTDLCELKTAAELAVDRAESTEPVEQTDHAESARLAKRRRIREQISKCETARQREAIVREQIYKLDLRVADAKEQHYRVCNPAQQRLREIEKLIATAAGDRQPVDDAISNEQLTLFQTIADQNEILARVTNETDKLKGPLENEAYKFKSAGAELEMTRDGLGRPGLARPDWLVEHFVAHQSAIWAGHRINSVEQQMERNAAEVEQGGHVHSVWRERWNAELTGAFQAKREAEERMKEIWQRMLDE